MSERNYERINDLPEGITPVTGAELVELEQDGVSRKFSMTALAGITNPHEETHQRGGADAVGTLEKTAYAIPYLESDGTIDSRVSDASTTKKGKVQLATSGEVSATKAVTGTDARLSDARAPTAHAEQHIAGTDVIADATVSNSGLMSAADKVKSDATIPAYIPTADQKAALAGTSGTPGTDNKYVTNADERLPTVNQKEAMMGSYGSPSGTNRFVTEEDPILGTGGESIDPMLHFVKKATGSAIPGRFATLPGTNDIASVKNDGYNDTLYLYRRTGDTWSLVGTPYQFLHSSGFVYLTGVSATQVAVIDTTSDTIHLYGHVNGVWSEAGGWISFQGSNYLSISGSAKNRVVMGRFGGVYKYSYYSSQWHYLGGTHLDPGESTEVSVAEISSTDVAVTCTKGLVDDFLARYTWNEETDKYDIVGTPYVFDPQPISARMTVNKGPGDSVFLQVWDGGTGGLGYYTAQFTWTGSTYAPIPGALPGSNVTVAYTSGTELLVYDGTNIAPYSFGMDVVNHRTTFLVSSGAMTAPDLPIGRGIVLMKDSAYDGDPVTITPPSGATFEGLASIELYDQYSYVEIERISETVFAIKDENGRLPTADQKAALVGTSGTPSASNPFVTTTDPRLGGGGGGVADEDNTAFGYQSLYSNTTGIGNTAVGSFTLSANTNGTANTAVGTSALQSNTTGSYNTAIGYQALFSNINGTDNTAIGTAALYTNTTGTSNTALGTAALQYNTTGIKNTAVGSAALHSNTTGTYNTALGRSALQSNTTGSYNTALGTAALYTNTTGINNTAVGTDALFSNINGTDNTALGASALYSNTGSNNTAVGTAALKFNTTGSSNTAVGTEALYSNTIGTDNTALGSAALQANTGGHKNTAIGSEALQANTGNNNTAIGRSAGSTNTTGSGNIFIGHNAQSSTPTASNEITLGSNFITSLRCAVTTITALSDRRDKKNIEKLEIGLDFVKALNPCGWNYDLRENYPDGKSDGSKMKKERNHGFIAQDLQEIQKKFKIDLGLVMDDNPDKLETSEGRLLPVLVKAVQELADRLEKLEGVK